MAKELKMPAVTQTTVKQDALQVIASRLEEVAGFLRQEKHVLAFEGVTSLQSYVKYQQDEMARRAGP